MIFFFIFAFVRIFLIDDDDNNNNLAYKETELIKFISITFVKLLLNWFFIKIKLLEKKIVNNCTLFLLFGKMYFKMF